MKNCTMSSLPVVDGKTHLSRSHLSRVAMAAALAACVGGNAYALGFGRLRVQSALGQPLRAEVDLTDVRAERSFKAGMAAPELYAQKGLEYSHAVKGIRTSVRQLSTGRIVLVLVSEAPINEPFIDVLLQASDEAGSTIRDFSILLDPPGAARAPEVTVAAPVVPLVPTATFTAPTATTAAPGAVAKPARRGTHEYIKLPSSPFDDEKATASNAGSATKKETVSRAKSGSVRVSKGETAGQIANMNRPTNVSLDQMLVALQRANSHAFINGNVNLLKSGVVLRMPSVREAQSVSATEARTIVVAQSEDFRTYRNQLARSPMAQTTPSGQQSAGKVQSRVDDTRTSPIVAPDTLTISKAEVNGSRADEQRMADAMQKKDNINRSEELNKNLKDLKDISAQAAASAQASAATPAIVVPPGLGSSSAAAELPASAASVAAAADAASQVASQAVQAASAASAVSSVPAKKPAQRKKPAPPQPEPSFFESLTDNPLFMGATGLAAIGGLAYMFVRRRRKSKDADIDDMGIPFQESDYSPDSFFHASGGKSIDTSEDEQTTAASGSSLGTHQSSMLYSPSQLDAEADVDPVSEADVYLAYGRDIQAEEILKDALFKHPDRISIYVKLLEIYERRHDVKAYAQFATELKKLTSAKGAEWDTVRSKGLEIDPGNKLYAAPETAASLAQPTELASLKAANKADSAANVNADRNNGDKNMASATMPVGNSASVQPTIRTDLLQQPTLSPATIPVTDSARIAHRDVPQESPIDLTLDMPEDNPSAKSSLQRAPEVPKKAADFNFTSLSPATVPATSVLSVPVSTSTSISRGEIDLTLDMPDEAASSVAASPVSASIDPSLNFDMSGLSLDIEQPATPAVSTSDPMATKLALAREFMDIGDTESARIMAREVAQNASSGELKAQAQTLLASIL